jgi:uncharacterized protein YbaP (TraB family)
MPTPEQMQAVIGNARNRGFLWRIEQGGHRSYLYGTIHLGRLAWSVPGPQVREALVASDTLALELDFTDTTMARNMTDAMAAPGKTAAPLPAPLRQRLARLADAACIPMQHLATQHPVMQALTLTVLAGRRDGLDPAFAQELSLAGFMRALNRPVVSLETPEMQLQALVPEDADDALRTVQQMVEQLEQDRARPVVLRLAEAWERGDLDTLDRYEEWCDCAATDEDREQLQRLNDARNPGLADRIDALHREGKRLFVAVGALHMTGPQGLPKLLTQRGYTVERVPLPR